MTQPAPIRVEVRFYSGPGYRKNLASWDDYRAWLTSPEFTVTAHRIRSMTVVTPHPKYAADPSWGQPRAARVDPWLGRGVTREVVA